MAIQTTLKRSFLRDAWDAAVAADDESPDLRAQLRANETASRKNISGGAIASVSANGRTTQFSTRGASQDDVLLAWGELVDLYDKLKSRDGLDADDDIYAAMIGELTPVTEFQNDFSLARCGV